MDRPNEQVRRSGPAPLLSATRPAGPEAVGELRRLVAERAFAAGVDEARIDDIRLVVSEAVSNVVVHAYAVGEPGPVQLIVNASASEAQIEISDDGCGFDAAAPSNGLGFGLTLMRRLCTHVAITRRPSGGTAVSLTVGLN